MKYSEFRPTAFDHHYSIEDREDWLVVPVHQNRDSGILSVSNFAAAIQLLGGESETVEVHRFGHWANGWFEIILVHPDRVADVETISNKLEDYPILDEWDLQEREVAAIGEAWENMSLKERCQFAKENGHSWFAGRRESAFDCNNESGDAVNKLINL